MVTKEIFSCRCVAEILHYLLLKISVFAHIYSPKFSLKSVLKCTQHYFEFLGWWDFGGKLGDNEILYNYFRY